MGACNPSKYCTDSKIQHKCEACIGTLLALSQKCEKGQLVRLSSFESMNPGFNVHVYIEGDPNHTNNETFDPYDPAKIAYFIGNKN